MGADANEIVTEVAVVDETETAAVANWLAPAVARRADCVGEVSSRGGR